MIAVVDSGVANLRSVSNALNHLGVSHHIAHTPNDLHGADKIILPGVGAFAAGMDQLRKREFIEPLREHARRGTPILGICLGMHLLFDCSDEMGSHEGLGILKGNVVRLPVNGPKVPHMGWNQLQHDGKSALLRDVPVGGYAYFVHSYYVQAAPEMTIASTEYGIDFPAVVGKDNIFAAQFHPEKSQQTGLRLLTNFSEM